MATIQSQYQGGELTVQVTNTTVTQDVTGLSLQVAGGSIPIPLTNGSGSVAIALHPSIVQWTVAGTLVPMGGPFSPPIGRVSVALGVQGGAMGSLQLIPPASEGEAYLIAPTSRTALRNAAMGLTPQASALDTLGTIVQDIDVANSLQMDVVLNVLWPAISGTSMIGSGTAAAMEALRSTLSPLLAFTVPMLASGTPPIQVTGMMSRAPLYQASANQYAEWVATLPNLTD